MQTINIFQRKITFYCHASIFFLIHCKINTKLMGKLLLVSSLNGASGGNKRIYYWNVQTVCTIKKNVFTTFLEVLNSIYRIFMIFFNFNIYSINITSMFWSDNINLYMSIMWICTIRIRSKHPNNNWYFDPDLVLFLLFFNDYKISRYIYLYIYTYLCWNRAFRNTFL